MSAIKEYMVSVIGEPAKVKIERNSKGYNWEVELRAEDMEEALRETTAAEDKLREKYGEKKNENVL